MSRLGLIVASFLMACGGSHEDPSISDAACFLVLEDGAVVPAPGSKNTGEGKDGQDASFPTPPEDAGSETSEDGAVSTPDAETPPFDPRADYAVTIALVADICPTTGPTTDACCPSGPAYGHISNAQWSVALQGANLTVSSSGRAGIGTFVTPFTGDLTGKRFEISGQSRRSSLNTTDTRETRIEGDFDGAGFKALETILEYPGCKWSLTGEKL